MGELGHHLIMARHLRVQFPGAIYHVTVRMLGSWRVDRSLLFRDDRDRERVLSQLRERVEQFNIRLYQFCLMTNHFHLVLETPEANLSGFMHSLTTAYTIYYNLRHRRHGHLVDGRYKAKLVEGDKYLLALGRYVHLNPVYGGPIEKRPIGEKIHYLRQYAWSTYLSYVGKLKRLDFVEYEPILAQMHGKKSQWAKRYEQFVETALAGDDHKFGVAVRESPRSIGSDGFRAWVEELYQKLVEKHCRAEDVSFRRITERFNADAVLQVLAGVVGVEREAFQRRHRNSLLRAMAARFLCRYAGLTQREVAELLGVGTGSAISRQMRRLRERLPEDRQLRQHISKAEKLLDERRAQWDRP